ncbi:MAG: MSMEG_0570 family nitrogen starvation response protein [Limnobacter sp.]|nr:MSMEG_0570 family nitrogen starvation response protein [Limnobacter sp.]
MPVVRFDVLWPDSTVMKCQSPSTVIRNFMQEGQVYPLPEFMRIAELGLNQASERVREKYGFACSAAADQLEIIQAKASGFRETPAAAVQVLRLD